LNTSDATASLRNRIYQVISSTQSAGRLNRTFNALVVTLILLNVAEMGHRRKSMQCPHGGKDIAA
jgi:hypothetical protein